MAIRILFLMSLFSSLLNAQTSIKGKIISQDSIAYSDCKVGIKGTSIVQTPTNNGKFEFKNLEHKKYQVQCYCIGQNSAKVDVDLSNENSKEIVFNLTKYVSEIEEVEAMGTLKETIRSESPIVTDIYDKKYFIKNPTPNLLDMMDRMNGVRSQVNCNVCGTGDIHLNGLEGPYTLIVLDGVPIVGGLSSVYGLSGIPSFLLDKIEVTKGPASSIYGSEAVAGVIHAFTKKPGKNPEIQFQHFASSQQEFNTDLGINTKISKKTALFLSANHYYFNNKLDQNKDNFTDVPLQNRFSIFTRLNFERKKPRVFYLSARYMEEKRWGGELNWNRSMRGSDSIYAETIDLKRAEVNLVYQLPFKEKILFLAHSNFHHQNSFYGNLPFNAQQSLFFSQLTWEKKINKHNMLLGSNYRLTNYDDNTFITEKGDSLSKTNAPLITNLPGIFWQHDIKFWKKNTFLYSFRTDYHKEHKFIFTPRFAYLKQFKNGSSFRIHAGTGFRIVNLFSEDHAALTGARQIVLAEKLNPERSKSINSSYLWSKKINENWNFEHDFQAFYTYFTNRIIPDYETNSNLIIYRNSKGFSESVGVSTDVKLHYKKTLSLEMGITYMEVSQTENGVKTNQILTEKISGNWTATYNFQKIPLSIDYTGNFVGPMRLPLVSELDPRPQYSTTYSIQNIQATYQINENFYIFGGVKNILNWTPAKGLPFLIARSGDPFDKNVELDQGGKIIPTASNPYGLSFDPAYVFAPNQGIRAFLGLRINFKKKAK